MSTPPKKPRRATTTVQAGIGNDPAHHAIVPPLYLTSTFEIENIDTPRSYEYSRTKNPTRDELSSVIAALEGGYGACITSSGMAALTLILHLLNPEDLIIAPYDCYGRSYRLLSALAEKQHFRLHFADQYSAQGIDDMFALNPKMILIESPSNPLMRVADIAAITSRAKSIGALTVVDNTFMSPVLQLPLSLGADIVFHSTTKFLNGHSDIVGGCVISSNKELQTDLDFWANSLGVIGAPFDSFMTLRGLRTLELRVRRAQENAGEIAKFLQNHNAVTKVHYAGLPDHPHHKIAKAQQEGFGSMLSFEINGNINNTKQFIEKLKVFRLAQSLGGTESLINHPATMTHVSMGETARAQAGITGTLLRLSVGVEHIEDLIADLECALDGAA